jgi:3'-5' exoribonuclease 1
MSFVVVDLEATCWSARTQPEKHAVQGAESEIIEIGAVRLDGGLRPVAEFQRFIRPVRHPRLSDFCTQLTHITQAQVDAADRFPVVYSALLDWMGSPAGVVLVSWGAYDHDQLVLEALAAGLPQPGWTSLDAREEFIDWARGHTGQRLRFGLGRALLHVGIAAVGTAHRGIDDARNLAQLFGHIRDPRHRSPDASRVLEVLHERHPRPANLGHLRARWPDAKTWFPRTSRELVRLGLALDAGQGRGLRLTEQGLSLV